MATYKTYRKEKWLFFFLSIAAYFVPFIVVTSVFFPMMDVTKGYKVAIGLAVVAINTVPFLMGVFRSFFAHFPLFNMLSIVFLILAAFFTMDVFRYYVEIFLWIETAAAVGSIAACILWHYYRKFGGWHESIKANVKSGAFVMKESDSK